MLYFLQCFLQRSVSIQLVFEILLIYYIIIIVRFASHAKINTFSVFILKNETGDPSVSQVLKLLESGFDSPEGSL